MIPIRDVIPSRTKPVVTVALLLTSALVFLYELGVGHAGAYELTHVYGVVPANFAWRRTLTSVFIQEGWIQFGSNMLCLWIFGETIEDTLGHINYGIFFFSTAIVTTIVYVGLHAGSMTPLVGASGAVAALMAAYFVLYPRSQLLTVVVFGLRFDVVEVPAIFLLALWIFLQLLVRGPSLDSFVTQSAGFLLGIATGFVVQRTTSRW
jgi:rhomboid family protein